MLNLVRYEAAPPLPLPLPRPRPPAALATQVQGAARPGYSAPPLRNVGLQPYLELHISLVVRGGGSVLSTTTVQFRVRKERLTLLTASLN